MYRSLSSAIAAAEQQGLSLSAVALKAESENSGRTVADIRAQLGRALKIMREAIERGTVGDLHSASGLVGGDAAKLKTGPGRPPPRTPVLAGARGAAGVGRDGGGG